MRSHAFAVVEPENPLVAPLVDSEALLDAVEQQAALDVARGAVIGDRRGGVGIVKRDGAGRLGAEAVGRRGDGDGAQV